MNRRDFIGAAAVGLGTCSLGNGQCADCEPHLLLPTKKTDQHQITKNRATSLRTVSLTHHVNANPMGYRYIGSNGGFDVLLENGLANQRGVQLARSVLGGLGETNILHQTSAFFGGIGLGNTPQVYITRLSAKSDGTGGAFHYSCAGTQLYIDCTYNPAAGIANYDPAARALALVEAELCECFQASAMNFPNRPQAWNCGWSQGEALSRVYAETFFPHILDDFGTVGLWLTTPGLPGIPLRPNWVDFTYETDLDPYSTGCGVAFIWWLIKKRGFNLGQVTWCGQNVLAETYALLTKRPRTEAFFLFLNDINAKFPALPDGYADYLTTNDEWL